VCYNLFNYYLNIFNLKNMRRILSFVVLTALVAGSAGMLSLFNMQVAKAASDTESQTIVLTVTSSITLTLATSTVDLGTLAPGVPITSDTSLTVVTNNYNGWNLQVRRDDATSTLNLNGTSTPDVTFPDATAWDGTNSSLTPGANLSFKVLQTGTDAGLYNATWWGADDAAAALYAGFPTTNQQIATIASYAGVTQNVAYRIRADAPGTQQSGVYSGVVTFTAITNP
jgi:hypothetical protein